MLININSPPRKYKTLYIDPPWPEQGGGKIKRGADRHYDLMSLEEIAALPVSSLADPEGCHLYLWVTNNYLRAGLDMLSKWGFEYITLITWHKDRQGLGQYFRGITEHCIFAVTKKRLPYKYDIHPDGTRKRAQGLTGFYEPKTKHSRKPEAMRQMIERVSYAPRLELFARENFAGWDRWGKEAPQNHTEELKQCD
jgi:N6-adenosine-specific RNA methylase IME4